MVKKNSHGGAAAPQAPAAPAKKAVALSVPALVFIIAASFVCGLFAGTFITPQAPQQVVHQAAPASVQQAPAQKPAAPRLSAEQRRRLAELEKEVLSNPKNREALVELGDLYFDTDQPAGAITAYESALKLDPNDANVLTDLGVMYRAVHSHEKAVEAFDRALAVDPGHPIAMFNKGIVLNYDLHKHDEAIAVWTELANQHPGATTPGGMPILQLIEQVKAEGK